MRFSERNGYRSPRQAIQLESIDDRLRNALWSVFLVVFAERASFESGRHGFTRNSSLEWFFIAFWHQRGQPIDTIPESYDYALAKVRRYFLECEWHDVFDFLELVAAGAEEGPSKLFRLVCNERLKEEKSAYRFVGGVIAPVVQPEELDAVEAAMMAPVPFPSRQHIERALELYADRNAPDYRNSVKESISAVEAMARRVSGDNSDTLGSALKGIPGLHPAFRKALLALYGYTSDKGGVRHALMEESAVTAAEAKFMLVACSAFVSFLAEAHPAGAEAAC